MYDYVAPLAKNPAFYSSDDTLTVTLQPPLITAQREISALEIKRNKSQEKINQAAAKRAGAFTPAQTWQDTLVNTAKSTAMAGAEAANSTEMSLINSEITHHKQQFGINLYKRLEELEDTQQFLPQDREIRSIYDNCRRDIEKARERRVAKEEEIKELEGGGSYKPSDPSAVRSTMPTATITTTQAQPTASPHCQQPYSVPVPAPPQPTVVAPPPAAPAPIPVGQATDPFASSPDPFMSAPAPAANDPFSLSSYAAQKEQQAASQPGMGISQPQSFMGQQQQQQPMGVSQPQSFTGQQQPLGFSQPQSFMGQQQPAGVSQSQPQTTLTMSPDPFSNLTAQPIAQQKAGGDPFAADFNAFGAPAPAASSQPDPFAGL